MIADVLLVQMKGAKYQAKLFLLHWVMKSYETPLKEGRVKNLASIFSVSERVVRDSLEYLVDHEYLIKVAYKDCNGRRQNTFELGDLTSEVISKESSIQFTPYQIDIVEKVLSSIGDNLVVTDKVEAVTTNNGLFDLKDDCKLVLAVLLLLGGSIGVVKGHGLADLSKFVCMSVEQIRPRLNELVKKGYIKSVVTGITGKILFGAKPSIYFLDLKHESFGTSKAPGPVIDIDPFINDSLSRGEAAKLFQHKEVENWPLAGKNIFNVEEKKKLLAFFKTPTMREVRYLQAYIDELAAYILSSYWSGLEEPLLPDEEIYLKIENDVLPAKFLDEKSQMDFHTIEQKRLFSRLIFEVSLGIAKEVKSGLAPNSKHDFVNMDIVIERVFEKAQDPRFHLDRCSLICFLKE